VGSGELDGEPPTRTWHGHGIGGCGGLEELVDAMVTDTFGESFTRAENK